MARQVQAVEINKFNAGLVTDASPLTTPDNSSLAEDNMVLNTDGSRNRRLGMDFENLYQNITTTITNDGTDIAFSTYRWDNAGGDPEKSLLVVQCGNEIKFFDLDNPTISSEVIRTYKFNNIDNNTVFSFTVVDGILVVATGQKNIFLFQFQNGVITDSTTTLKIRDLFGVSDVYRGEDLTIGSGVMTRPFNRTPNHLYNLRNQSWSIPRLDGNFETLQDPVRCFTRVTDPNLYPSNSDSVVQALYPDAEDEDNRTVDRFFAEDLISNPLGTTRVAQGFFIIDALERGVSRIEEEVKIRQKYPELSFIVNSLPRDITPGGASAITEFAGRVFYGGFSGEVIEGDDHSPKMSSYILFSKVVTGPAEINQCYQDGDPTSREFPDIVATDGGFIRINGAYGIKRLINLGSSLIVIASNGVWRIVGGSDNGFTATSYIVEKIGNRGCVSVDSIVVVENSVMFWGEDGIFNVGTDQYGSWVVTNIVADKIQRLYDAIQIEDKITCRGAYDSYEKKVRWIYNTNLNKSANTKELILDVQLTAFYTNTIGNFQGSIAPKVVSIYVGPSYSTTVSSINVVVGSDPVTVLGEQVVINHSDKANIDQREVGYLAVTSGTGNITYSFSKYSNDGFRDWFSYDGVGIDAAAFVDCSYFSGTDYQRNKSVPYITIHLRRTETGIDSSGNPINPSSCLVQAKWSWSDSDRSGKWGREFQAYRYRRLYIPEDLPDDYDNGFLMVSSKNKLRGSGKVLSLTFRTEPDKDFHLYGWSMIFSVSENV